MYPCKNCNKQVYPLKKNFTIKNLKGNNIFVNGIMYCSKDCFVMKNIFTRRYEVFDFDTLQNERNSLFCSEIKYNLNEKKMN
tara:strand:- start:2520 stop:2765 length:246 start_codon:yes stop_codon:yes gene_type:complete